MRAFIGLVALILILNTISAFAEVSGTEIYQSGISQYEKYREKKVKNLSNKKHSPALMLHGEPTEYVVVLFHGLYESPRSVHGLAEEFYAKGMNVFMPTLPGHWQRDNHVSDVTSYKEWLKEVDLDLALAEKFGKKIIVAGFSLGGVLAVQAALKYPEKVKGLFLWAPALGVSGKVGLASSLGSLLGVDANNWEKSPADGHDTPYYSLQMALQIIRLHKYINKTYLGIENSELDNKKTTGISGKELAEKIQAPTFLAYSTADEAISEFQVKRFYKNLNVPKKLVLFNDIKHTPTSKSRKDANPLRPGEFNPHFESMARDMSDFIDQNL